MNFKTGRKLLWHLALWVAVFIFQTTFLANFNIWFRNINLILVALVFLIGALDISQAIIYVILAGLFLDIYSGLPFGIFMLSLFMTLIILEILMINLLTNRSYYSLISLGIIGVVVYNSLLFLVVGFMYLIGASDIMFNWGYGGESLIQLINMVVFLSFIFWIANKLSSRFKPIFLPA